MHRKLTALTGGLVLAFALAIPAAANAAAARPSSPALPAATQHGCGVMHDQGNGRSSVGLDQIDLTFLTNGSLDVCNDGVANGEFEMGTDTSLDSGVFPVGCFAADPNSNVIDLDRACGGNGQVYDRWTAIKEGTSAGAIIWEFRNQNNGQCMYNNTQASAIYAACNNTNHFEWFTWPQSNLS